MIKRAVGKELYYDKNGMQITAGCMVKYSDGRICKVYATTDNKLGIDATNPKWIESGRAYECEYGIYPFTIEETDTIEVIKE